MRFFAGCLALAALAALIPGRAAEPTKDDLLRLEQQLKTLHETAGPSVACVVVSRSEKYPKPAKAPEHPGQLGGFDRQAFLKAEPGKADLARHLDLSDPVSIPDHGYAGGVVIDPAGLVLVNAHSVDGATKIYVHLPGGKGSYADIHAADVRSDLAVLKLLTPPEGLKPIRLATVRLPEDAGGKATVFPGKLVVPMAHPYAGGFAMNRPAAALGSVTNIQRRLGARTRILTAPPVHRSVYNYSPVLAYDARANLGYSGVALLNLDGQLIGLSTTTAVEGGGENGVGYAVPLDENLRRIVDVLRRGEEVEYGFLGVALNEEVPGVTLKSVTPRSPAALAGLQPTDRIVRINDHRANTYEDLLLRVGSALAGTKVRLAVSRRGQDPWGVDVTLAKFKSDTSFLASVRPAPVFGLWVDYESVLAMTLTDGIRAGLDVPAGVTVRELVPDSPAAARFRAIGETKSWLITHVNGTPTPSPADFYQAAKGIQSVKLTVYDVSLDNPRAREVTLP
ncbi:MAG: degQ 1 [Gemmataceae bacterium]|nr:degQ 1 [Gemmataceae bacterium]